MHDSLFTPSAGDCFKPSQIVCLEDSAAVLYAEVIQAISARQMCWVRPLLLAPSVEAEVDKIYDLRKTSDLVWPERLFRVAIDTEVIPLLVRLERGDGVIGETLLARQQLHAFIQRIWESDRALA